MNKYKLGQTLYWIKHKKGYPELMFFQVKIIKQDCFHGYRYGAGIPGCAYICEPYLFITKEDAINDAIKTLKGLEVKIETEE